MYYIIVANIGLFSLYCAQYCDTLRVIAVEPVLENRELLCRNLHEKSIPSVVYACSVGVDEMHCWNTYINSSESSSSINSDTNTTATTIFAQSIHSKDHKDNTCREFTVINPLHTQVRFRL